MNQPMTTSIIVRTEQALLLLAADGPLHERVNAALVDLVTIPPTDFVAGAPRDKFLALLEQVQWLEQPASSAFRELTFEGIARKVVDLAMMATRAAA
jgi:hypothetical protein